MRIGSGPHFHRISGCGSDIEIKVSDRIDSKNMGSVPLGTVRSGRVEAMIDEVRWSVE